MSNIQGSRRGYTFFELLTVIGITVIFGSVALLNLPTGLRSKLEIENAMSNLRNHLILVQQRAISQENGAKWGIHIDTSVPGQHFYQIFYGDSYETGTIVETIYLPDGMVFLSPAEGNTEDILFEKVTGRTEDGHSIVIGSGEPPYDEENSGGIIIDPGTGVPSQEEAIPDFDFSISVTPASSPVQAGGSVEVVVDADIIGGIPQSVIFSAENLPANTTTDFSQASCLPSCDSTLTIQTTSNTPGGTHLISVVGTAGSLNKSANFSLIVNTQTVPGTPTDLSAASGAGQISLDWQPPAFTGGSPITGYKIYRSAVPGGEGAPEIATAVFPSHVDSGLSSGASYYYKVTAMNAVGESAMSGEANAVTFALPGAPVNLTGLSGSGQAVLNWQTPSTDGGSPITEYRIYRSATSGGSLSQVGTVSGALTFTNTGLSNGTAYYYKITAVNAVGEGGLSNEVSVVAGSTRIFVTSTNYNGNLGGFSGADSKCAVRASAAGLTGTWKAWLSDETTNAADRLTHNSAPYLNMIGEKVADNWTDLTDNSLDIAIRYNEFGASKSGQAWTGSYATGAKYFSQDCSRWTSSTGSGGDAGLAGFVTSNSNLWSFFGSNSCGTSLPLYCFEQ